MSTDQAGSRPSQSSSSRSESSPSQSGSSTSESNDFFEKLRVWTQARIGLGITGHSVPTEECLKFRMAHAMAKDAVIQNWDYLKLKSQLEAQGEAVVQVSSLVQSREEFLKRPDLGRKLDPKSEARLRTMSQGQSYDVAVIASDGLSSVALDTHFLPLWRALKGISKGALETSSYRFAPLVLAPYSRVAISDEIGAALNAKVCI